MLFTSNQGNSMESKDRGLKKQTDVRALHSRIASLEEAISVN